MSGHRTTSAQYEIIATTRRRWSTEQKRAMVAEIAATGASVSEVARRHGIHAGQLFRWRSDFGLKPAASAVETLGAPRFVPVVVAPCPQRVPLPSPSAPSAPVRRGIIEIQIAGGRAVRVDGDVDTAALVRIIDALEALR